MAFAGSAAAVTIANAIKASGAIVQVDERDFQAIVERSPSALVITAESKILWTIYYQYLTAYKGLVFHTQTKSALHLPGGVELVRAQKIWIPAM